VCLVSYLTKYQTIGTLSQGTRKSRKPEAHSKELGENHKNLDGTLGFVDQA